MAALSYPVTLEPDDNDTILVTFADFPGATFGIDRDDALRRAEAFLVDVIECYLARGTPIPAPSLAGTERVAVPQALALTVSQSRPRE